MQLLSMTKWIAGHYTLCHGSFIVGHSDLFGFNVICLYCFSITAIFTLKSAPVKLARNENAEYDVQKFRLCY